MDKYQALERLSAIQQEIEWRKCRESPAYFIRRYCWTFDAHDKDRPYKPMVESESELPYLDLVVKLYREERRLILLKSRQLRITWICCALDVHEAMFWSARAIPINAYKEDDAKDILDRCLFVYQGNPNEPDKAPGLPIWMRNRAPMEHRERPPEMEWVNGSLIRAIPEGSENVRGKTISRWRCEEARSQPKLEQTCQGILPSLQKVGQAVFVSSAGPGYYEQLVHDKIDFGDPPPREMIETGLEGVTMWRNPRNGYLVCRIHYTADPAKRDPNWLATVTAGMPEYQVRMEYEIDFTARGGQPALTFFVENEKLIVVDRRDIPKWWPRFATADYGVTSPYSCHFHAVSPDGTLVTYWEYYAPGALGDHLAAITAHPDWPLIQLFILDKSCWAATQQVSDSVAGRTLHGVRSIADLHADFGVYAVPATVTGDQVKVSALSKEWSRPKVGGEGWRPTTLISKECPELIRELHGIKWAPLAATAVHWQEKLVDRDNHAFDDLCYGVLHYRMAGMEPSSPVDNRTSEEVVSDFRRQRCEGYVRQIEARLSGIEMVPEEAGDEPYGLVH